MRPMPRGSRQVSTVRLLLVAALAGAGLLALPGCAAGDSALANTTWVLVQEEQSESSLLESTEITLEFFPGEGAIRGSYGYNKYAGNYEVDGNSLTISSDLCWTTMACQAEGGMDEEQAYIFTLMKAESYVVEGDTLTSTAGDEKLVFREA